MNLSSSLNSTILSAVAANSNKKIEPPEITAIPLYYFPFDNDYLNKSTRTSPNVLTNPTSLTFSSVYKKSGSYSLNFGNIGYVSAAGIFNNIPNGTISLWVYLNALDPCYLTSAQSGSSYAILSIGTHAQPWGGGSDPVPGGSYVYWHGSNSFGIPYSISKTQITAGSWNHIALTFNASSCTIYVNGDGGQYNVDYHAQIPANNGLDQYIGYWSPGFDRINVKRVNGYIDDFRIYDVELSPSDISLLYTYNYTTIYVPPPVIEKYPDDLGQIIPDAGIQVPSGDTSNPYSLVVSGVTNKNGTYIFSGSKPDFESTGFSFYYLVSQLSFDNHYFSWPYVYSNNNYVGSATTIVNGEGTITAAWLQIQFPKQFILKVLQFYYFNGLNYYIVGSNDGTSWDVLFHETNSPTNVNTTVTLASNTSYYLYLRILIPVIGFGYEALYVSIQSLRNTL